MDSQFMIILGILLGSTIRYTVPILYAALGGLITEKAGVLNFALEGLMLAGAFFAYYGNLVSGSILVGVLSALAIGALTGLILSISILKYKASQLVMGIGINIFYLGLTGYFFRIIGSSGADTMVDKMLGVTRIPLLADIPLIGILFEQNVLVYLLIVLVILTSRFFNKTTTGLNMKAVGENPYAAAAVGVDVLKNRTMGIVVGCMMASLGGGVMTLTMARVFLENMVNGRGWIAFSAIILGRYTSKGTLVGCLIFGAATALSDIVQIVGIQIPYQAALMVPYIITIAALVFSVGSGNAPAALGARYDKE
jgi:simple sugar transport system permease protein